jgi:hypothetical protein
MMPWLPRALGGALAAAAAVAALSTRAPAQQPPAAPAARAATGYLAIAGIDNGPATVTVNGRPRGELTAEEMTLELPPGSAEVVVSKPGFSACRHTVTVPANDLVRFVCRLGPAAARIVSDASQNSWGAQQTRTLRIIHLEPSAVPIEIGSKRGTTPATVQLPVGDNALVLNGRPLCLQVAAPATDRDTAILRVVVRAGTPQLVSGVSLCGPGAGAPPIAPRPLAPAPKALAPGARRGAAPAAAKRLAADARRATVPRDSANAAAAPRPPTPTRPAFRLIDMDQAAGRLGGTVRYIDGLALESVKIGPGSLVPGADDARDVVRVLYLDPRGRRIQLDQQRLPTPRDTSSAARQQALPAGLGLAWGDTLLTTGPDGDSRFRWLDQAGLWLSLTASLPEDSLRALLDRIH